MSFNFGEEVVSSTGSIAQAEVGAHQARLKGILHLGIYEDSFQGKKKAPAPFVCALFELKSGEEGGGVNEDGSPIVMHKTFALRKGDRAFLTNFMQVMLTADEYKKYKANVLEGGFEDLIGRVVTIDAVGSSTTNEDGTPRYVNVGGISKVPAAFAKHVAELEGEPLGHVTLSDYTEEAMRALPVFEIYDRMEQAVNFAGSQADRVLRTIRKEEPEFAMPRTESKASQEEPVRKPLAPPVELNEDEDFA